jgi:hypothetical protein
MRILFERTGGFAGRKIQGWVDSSALPTPQAQRLTELLAQSHFFDLPLKLPAPPVGADRFCYKVTVETSSGSHTVEAAEAAVPDGLRPLLDWLTRQLSLK